jgi:hypothetical protein
LLSGAGAVVALVVIEWAAGWVGAAAWTQSWGVVKRGHFRITGWIVAVLGILAYIAGNDALSGLDSGATKAAVVVLAVSCLLYMLVQYSRTDVPGAVLGAVAALGGAAALILASSLIRSWPDLMAAATLVSGALLLGAVTNGMMLGHWYLNQPGLKPWALARLSDLALASVVLSALAGIAAVSYLTSASTEGAVLGLPGFGESFSTIFFVAWLTTLGLTGAVVWGARRCVRIRSIQSATGLFYAAVLAAGVSEFLVRYLMVNAT